MDDLIAVALMAGAVLRGFASFFAPDPMLASNWRLEAGMWFGLALLWMRRDRG